MKKISLVLFSFFSVIIAFGQVNTSNTLTPESLIQSVLVGQGIVVSNVKYNNSLPNAQVIQGNALSFNSANFPFSSGVYLRTNGGVGTVNYDPDLNALATNTVTNGCIIEFDFIPSGDTISFRYMFASSEYPTYVCSGFNDVFGFFISGPGFSGGFQNGAENIALIPGGNIPVAINTVNSGVAGGAGSAPTCAAQDPNWQANSIYYSTTYGGTVGYPYNAGTVVMTANASVQCGQVYHIKLAISNVGDQALDSGVYLEGDSFSSEAVDIAVATVTGDTTVIENCTNAQFIFSRPQTQLGDTLVVNYSIAGDAIMGTDYNNLVNPITFLPGEDTIILTLNPAADGITEAPETVIITAITVTPCGDTITTTGTLYIIDGPILNIVEVDPTVLCANDSVMSHASVTNGFGPYTYSWNYLNQTNDTAYFAVSQNGSYDYLVTATDVCGNTGTDTVTVTMNQTLAIDTMAMVNTNFCANTGVVWGLAVGETGQPQFNWSGPSPSSAFTIDASVMQNLPAGMYVFTITDDVCSVTDSIQVGTDPGPIADFTSSLSSGCDPLDVAFTNQSQNATSYSWNFGNGNTANVNDLSTQNQTYSSDATIMLVAYAGVCSDTVYGAVDISICGCMDPIALNYNPLATVEDGSCVFPTPTVSVPNVFTPNGDGSNQVFELTTTNAVKIDLVISNRWGNKMVEKSGLGSSISWDGTVNGLPASEGVYFYQYTVYGVQGDELKGHGFVQLIR